MWLIEKAMVLKRSCQLIGLAILRQGVDKNRRKKRGEIRPLKIQLRKVEGFNTGWLSLELVHGVVFTAG